MTDTDVSFDGVVDKVDEMVKSAVADGVPLEVNLDPSQSESYRDYVTAKYRQVSLQSQIDHENSIPKM